MLLVFREKPRFERIFAAKMTGLPHAQPPIRQRRERLRNDCRVMVMVMGWAIEKEDKRAQRVNIWRRDYG